MSFSDDFLKESVAVISGINTAAIEKVVDILAVARSAEGRLFILGVGGSAASASHAVNDFRKLCGFETYSPTDNVAELTARSNDEGWDTVFSEWLKTSRLNEKDVVLILSVGGGDLETNVSPNIVKAIQLAKEKKSKVVGIVGRDGGYTAKQADACVLIPVVNPANITPHTEAMHGVVWHLMVSHPKLKLNATKWESIAR